MHLSNFLVALLGIFITAIHAADTATDSKVTVYAWPLSAKTPSPLAEISYSKVGRADSYTPPEVAVSDEIVRVGLYDPSTQHWSGIATSASNFSPDLSHKITIYLDERKKPYHVGFSTSRLPSGTSSADTAIVEVVGQQAGPQPYLNKPVVLSPEGKMEQPVQEKTFIQKYWWLLAVFLLVQLIGGGGDEKK